MRRLGFLSLSAVLVLSSACSLHSLERLERCTGKPTSAACPSAAAGASGGGASAEGGVSAQAGVSAGGAPSQAGEPSAAGESQGGAAGSPQAPDLVLLYADHSGMDKEPSRASRAIRPNFSIENRGESAVPLEELSLRYYYKLEAGSAQTFLCDFVHPDAVVDDCDGVLGSFGTLDGTEAKNFVEVTFAPPGGQTWLLAPLGGQSGVMQLRFYNGNFAPQDQTNDYSFDPTKAEVPQDWDHVTLYRGGQLVYGIEPK